MFTQSAELSRGRAMDSKPGINPTDQMVLTKMDAGQAYAPMVADEFHHHNALDLPEMAIAPCGKIWELRFRCWGWGGEKSQMHRWRFVSWDEAAQRAEALRQGFGGHAVIHQIEGGAK